MKFKCRRKMTPRYLLTNPSVHARWLPVGRAAHGQGSHETTRDGRKDRSEGVRHLVAIRHQHEPADDADEEGGAEDGDNDRIEPGRVSLAGLSERHSEPSLPAACSSPSD